MTDKPGHLDQRPAIEAPTGAQEETTCAYPGCTRPRAAGMAGRGSKPKYCDDTEHTAATAFRERNRQARATGRPTPDDLGRPVTMATARAAELRTAIGADLSTLLDKVARALEELRVIADPEAAEAQIEAIQADAAQQIAAAEARAVAEAGR